MTRTLPFLLVATTALAACAPANHHPQAPTPARSLESLSDEARVRRLDLIDAVRLPDLDKLRATFAPNAFLVRPTGDTVRGIDAIGRELLALRASQPITTVRGIPMAAAVRCYDGLLDQRDEYSLTILGADSIPHFIRGPMAIHWTTRGDSLAIGEVDLTSNPVTRDERMGCVNTDAARYASRRVEIFYAAGLFTPTSFYTSADHELSAAGYNLGNSPDEHRFPDGGDARSEPVYGISGRLTDHAWITVAGAAQPERSDIGRCDPSTFNYVHVGRQRRPWFVSLDAHGFHGFSAGLGPAFVTDHYVYRDADFYPRPPDQVYYGHCSAAVLNTPDDSTQVTHRSVGAVGNLTYQMPAGPHFGFLIRAQFVRFPTTPAFTTSRGMSMAFRDLTTTLGVGMAFTY